MRTFVFSCVCLAAACGPKGDPTERYVRALNAKAGGDSEAYFDALVALAHDEPDSRAGRRARAMLQGPDLFTYAAVAGVLSAIAIPNFLKFKERAQAIIPTKNLRALYIAQRSYYAEHNRYGSTFSDIAFVPEPSDPFVYFLSSQESAASSALSGRDTLRRQAARALSQFGVTPRVTKTGFLAAAAANLDADDDLEVWTLDESGEPVNLLRDLDPRL